MNCCEDPSKTKTDLFAVDDELLNVFDDTVTELPRPEALLLVPDGMHSSFASRMSVPISLDGANGITIGIIFAPLSSRLSSST